ncbi:MAG: hypothetical protein FD141_944 [Fusobacteria bacterium]|nr:MAG: hypothetical protein FD141_944 [Fusobacteriota bacterium]KAF0229657.1 MAG: hypothetical protein FD182_47 [Fusobacteriota bacterium]
MNFPKITNIRVNKKELLIVVILTMIALISFFLFRISGQGAMVEIKIAQKLIGTYDLSIDQEVPILDDKGNLLMISVIKDGMIKVVSSNCPDKICIDEGSINLAGQTIVCLPNKVVIKIIGNNDETIDGVLQ